MRVQLKLHLDCEPDAAWEAVRSPRAMRDLYAPVLSMEPVGGGGFPAVWPAGEHELKISALFGIIAAGGQRLDLSFSERGGARILQDAGGPTSGALAIVTHWRHRIAIAPGRSGGTLYRDRLDFRAGLATPIVWIGLWALWQWRGRKLQRLAKTWRASR